MIIDFVEEPENELIDRKNLYINSDSELSLTLSRIQDSLDSNGFPVTRSSYKYVKGKLCKFQIELISSPDLALLTKRTNSLKKLNINIAKMKWDFGERGSYFMKIGKIQDKDLHIVVASFHTPPSSEDYEKIKMIRDKAIRNDPDKEDDEDDEDDPGNESEEEKNEVLEAPIQLPPLPSLPVKQPPPPQQRKYSQIPSPPTQRQLPPLQASSSSGNTSMTDIQNQHNRALGRAGINNSTIHPTASVRQNTTQLPPQQSQQSSTPSRSIYSQQPLSLLNQTPTPPQPRHNQQFSSIPPSPSTQIINMPRPNIILYQQRQLQVLKAGNKSGSVTSFKIRD